MPSCFIAGTSDWGVYQTPGLVDIMRTKACTQMVSFNLIDGAGHWVQHDQLDTFLDLVDEFLA